MITIVTLLPVSFPTVRFDCSSNLHRAVIAFFVQWTNSFLQETDFRNPCQPLIGRSPDNKNGDTCCTWATRIIILTLLLMTFHLYFPPEACFICTEHSLHFNVPLIFTITRDPYIRRCGNRDGNRDGSGDDDITSYHICVVSDQLLTATVISVECVIDIWGYCLRAVNCPHSCCNRVRGTHDD